MEREAKYNSAVDGYAAGYETAENYPDIDVDVNDDPGDCDWCWGYLKGFRNARGL